MSDLNRQKERSARDIFSVMDRFFGGYPESTDSAGGYMFIPAIDVVENDHAFIITAEMPGIRKDDIQVSIHDGVLTISTESGSAYTKGNEGRVVVQERRFGKYLRKLRLGTPLNESGIKAVYKDGVLHLTLPKAEQVKPRKIAVQFD